MPAADRSRETEPLPDEVQRIFEKPILAYVATNGPDGYPHVSPVWVDVEDGKIAFNTERSRVKYRNLERDPRVTISAEDPEALYRPVMVKGRARMTTAGAVEQIDRLAKKYVGMDRYEWSQPEDVRVKVVVDHTSVTRS